MTKSLILAALIFGAVDGSAAESAASGLSASDQAQAASEPALLVLERQIVLKQKERTEGKIVPDAYREWETKFRTTLSGAIAAAPKTPENAAAVVRIQTLLGEGKSAEASLERSLEENPGNPSLLLTKGQLLHKRGDFQGAAENALLAWEKSGRTEKSAWALYQETKGRVAPSPTASHLSPAGRNAVRTTVSPNASKDSSSLFTGAKPKPGAVIVPNVAAPEDGAPTGDGNRGRLVTLLGVVAGVCMIAWAALPQTTKDRLVDPFALWRKTNTADHLDEAVTHHQFLEHIKGRTLAEVIHEGDVKPRDSTSADGPIRDVRYVILPTNPDIILDMRHFLVVGRMGETTGIIIEAIQAYDKQDSAFQSQDLISNAYGTTFFANYNHAKPLDKQLTEFFKNPDKFGRGWKIK